MLQRHVEVLNSFRCFGNCRKKSVGDMRRVSVHHAYPLELFDLTERTDQRRESVDFAQLLAVTRRVLSDKYDFLHTLLCEVPSFLENRAKSSRAKRASH